MPNIVKCGNPNCDYISAVNDIDPETGKQQPCPKCGSLKRIIDMEEIKEGLNAGDTLGGEHEVHMNPQSWSILAIILAIIITPLSYITFSSLTINIWYRLLIWIAIIIIPFSLAYKYRIIWYKIIMLLRFLADKTYGKHEI